MVIAVNHSIHLYLKSILLALGVACAYLTKQYGLVLFPAGLFLLIYSANEMRHKSHHKAWIALFFLSGLLLLINTWVRPILYLLPCVASLIVLKEHQKINWRIAMQSILLYGLSFVVFTILILLLLDIHLIKMFEQTQYFSYEKWGRVSSGKFFGLYLSLLSFMPLDYPFIFCIPRT